MYILLKQYFKKNFPTIFKKLRSIKDQLVIEAKTLRQVGLIRILKQFIGFKQKWKAELPLQKIRKIKMIEQSLDSFKRKNNDFKQGGHTVYFSPDIILKTSLQTIIRYMPEIVGIKIVSRIGSIDTPYVASDKTCLSHTYMSPLHYELILVHGVFTSLGLGPRLYDVIELEFNNGDVHIAYAMEHIDGNVCVSKQECENFIQKIQMLEKSKLIKLINWNGYNDMDFKCPSCNGNLIFEQSSGQLKYVDLQNFALDNYYDYFRLYFYYQLLFVQIQLE